MTTQPKKVLYSHPILTLVVLPLELDKYENYYWWKSGVIPTVDLGLSIYALKIWFLNMFDKLMDSINSKY